MSATTILIYITNLTLSSNTQIDQNWDKFSTSGDDHAVTVAAFQPEGCRFETSYGASNFPSTSLLPAAIYLPANIIYRSFITKRNKNIKNDFSSGAL